jgi:phytanoyl-CoA hydroxylase
VDIKMNPVTLTEEQIKFYDQNGYLIGEGLFDEVMCDQIKSIAAKEAAEDGAVSLNIHRKVKTFFEIMSNPILTGIVKAVQRHKVVGTNDQYLYKRAGTPYAKQSWTPHQDSAYVNAKYGVYMQVHIFLDAQDKENGGLYCYPTSHKEPILPYEYKKSWREEFDENGISHPGWKVEVPSKYKRIDVFGPKGGFFLQHGNLIHGSHPNVSKDRSREQFSMAFLNEGEQIDRGETSIKIPVKLE